MVAGVVPGFHTDRQLFNIFDIYRVCGKSIYEIKMGPALQYDRNRLISYSDSLKFDTAHYGKRENFPQL